MKINWKSKLSSRKFWALVASFIASLLVIFKVGENEIAQITAVITAFGSVAVYILAEASVDKATAKNKGEDDSSNEKNK
ncbi:hypothetical protein NST17_06965 [Caldifermentibacillus hisashii]|uniref:Holin n=1 Tax=Caldifermentibacillus hisashii TaxID=996558 RepID=A0ABU9JVQ3_9BACI